MVERLLPDEDFVRYAARYGGRQPRQQPDATAVAQSIALRHCAGHAGGRIEGAAILDALNANADHPGQRGEAAGWLLSTIAPHECALLIARCGVSPRQLARHLRSRPAQGPAVVRFLNQFAVPGR